MSRRPPRSPPFPPPPPSQPPRITRLSAALAALLVPVPSALAQQGGTGAAASAHRSAPISNIRYEVTFDRGTAAARDRKSTRLNSSHANISYAVFCLKKNKCT